MTSTRRHVPDSMRAAALTLAAATGLYAQPQIAGCPVFPAGNAWNTPIDHLPLHPDSGRYIDSIGRARNFHPDFGAGLYEGGPIGIPFVTVPFSQPASRVTFQYADESDPGPYPIPPDPPIEGGPASTGDRHILILQRDTCRLYELFDAHPLADGSWRAGSGAIFDLRSHRLRPSGWTSADAAGLPILPGLVRYDEVAAGEIAHAIRFTVRFTRRAFVWPARHFASSRTGTEFPAMGQRFRLRGGFDISGFHPENQVILRALKKYGIILADNGSDWFLSGVPDDRWNNQRLRELRRLAGNDFEAVDASSLMIDAGSGEARQPATAAADRLVHAATFRPGPVAPGMLLSLYPPEPADSVRFDDVEAELLYRSPMQINLVTPPVLRPGSQTRVEARAAGRTVWQASLPVAASVPGVFGVLNQDYSLNAQSNPAAAGSWLLIFGTGGSAGQDRVTAGGAALDVSYSGPAPGFTPALTQINALLPSGAPSGRQMLVWSAGLASSPGFPVYFK